MTWRRWFHRRTRRTEVDAEIESHLAMATRDRIARGVALDEARRQAALEFGSVGAVRDEARAIWSLTALEHLAHDARAGARILTRSPGLSVPALVLIALVIGGNTTLYSVVYGLLTKPAPGIDPHGLVAIAWQRPDRDHPRPELPYGIYSALAAESLLVRPAGFRYDLLRLTHDGGSVAVRGAAVSLEYFDVLRVPIAHGRSINQQEDRLVDGTGLVALISERLWDQQLSRSPAAIGRTVTIDGQPATIVGVVAHPFQGARIADSVEVWVPLVAFARATGRAAALDDPADRFVHGVVARLSDDASMAEAAQELAAIAMRAQNSLRRDAPRDLPRLVAYTGIAGTGNQVERFGPRFLGIFTLVALITVVIVCANVANLMLARAVSRQREMAMRQSFGASRWRIVRLVFAEGLTLSLVAWALACLVSYWLCRVLADILPPSHSGNVQVLLDFTPDWHVLAYAALMASAATVAFTLAPALRTWRQDLLAFLKAGERGIAPGRSRLSQTLVVCQLSLSVLLLVGAGLGWRSLALMQGTSLGFSTDNLLLVTVDTRAAAASPAARSALLRTLRDQLLATPGALAVSYAQHDVDTRWQTMSVRTTAAGDAIDVEVNAVGPGYFRVLGVSPVSGASQDDAGAGGGVVINQHLADALWPDGSALGRTVLLGTDARALRVTGVIPNVLPGGYRRESRPMFLFLSMDDAAADVLPTFFVRYAGSVDAIVPAIRRGLREAAPAAPVYHVTTFAAQVSEFSWLYRTLARLLLVFACASVVIAAVGQYAAMAFAMRQRVRDFAIRLAIGASSRQIVTSGVGEGLWLTVIGLAAGLLLGACTGHAARALLHGVTPTDAATYLGVVAVLGLASLVACYLPAQRSARVNPVDALRSE